MAGTLSNLLNVVFPKRTKAKGVSHTNTFSADRRDQVLSAPNFKEHTTDIFESRQADDSRELLKKLFIHDTDVSAAVNAFLTVADTSPIVTVKDVDGQVDRKGMQDLNQILTRLTTRFDYSKGFELRPSIRALCEDMRYMLLLRGGIGHEVVFDKLGAFNEVRTVDMTTVEWFEKEPNKFIPQQRSPQTNEEILLDIPTFFTAFFRRDPTSVYTYSPFVSAINTIAARQQVINDLYRIMTATGFPRMEAVILEEVLLKHMPADIKADPTKHQAYINEQVAAITNNIAGIRSDQALVHLDSVELKVYNDKNPGVGIDINNVIAALNAMNQAGLRSMATILGRGESGVNTASVEARIFSMSAEALNAPLGEIWSKMLTMVLRVMTNTQSRVEVTFTPVELRPDLELEPQRLAKSARLRQDLSDGIITDDEYHLAMYGRIRPDAAPELSGTGFMNSAAPGMDTDKISPNSDPLGRSISPDGGDKAKGDDVKK